MSMIRASVRVRLRVEIRLRLRLGLGCQGAAIRFRVRVTIRLGLRFGLGCQGALMGVCVLLINVEAWLAKRLINAATAGPTQPPSRIDARTYRSHEYGCICTFESLCE